MDDICSMSIESGVRLQYSLFYHFLPLMTSLHLHGSKSLMNTDVQEEAADEEAKKAAIAAIRRVKSTCFFFFFFFFLLLSSSN